MNSFFADLFELWGSNISPISDELYEFNIFGTIGMVWGLMIIFGFFTFYYFVNSARWNKPIHWLLVGLGIAVVNCLFSFFYSVSTFRYENIESDYLSQGYIHLMLTIFISTLFFFFVISMAGKWWSVNCSKTPF